MKSVKNASHLHLPEIGFLSLVFVPHVSISLYYSRTDKLANKNQNMSLKIFNAIFGGTHNEFIMKNPVKKFKTQTINIAAIPPHLL